MPAAVNISVIVDDIGKADGKRSIDQILKDLAG